MLFLFKLHNFGAFPFNAYRNVFGIYSGILILDKKNKKKNEWITHKNSPQRMGNELSYNNDKHIFMYRLNLYTL